MMSPSTFIPGEDYYYNEQGMMVLTAKFLLKRGYCCGNGCLHCPYTKPEVMQAPSEQDKPKK